MRHWNSRRITDDRLQASAGLIEAALDLLHEPEELYRLSSDKGRRLLNQAIFERLHIDESEVTDHRMTQPFAELHSVQQQLSEPRAKISTSAVVGQPMDALLLSAVSLRGGSSKSAMVEAMGIEPTNLLHAMQALYQLSYAPVGTREYQPGPSRGRR